MATNSSTLVVQLIADSSRFQAGMGSAGSSADKFASKLENSKESGDRLEESSEGISYSLRGLSGVLGGAINPQVLNLLEGYENLGGGIKRLVPQIGAATASFEALSVAQKATLLGAAGLVIGLGALVLTSKSVNKEAKESINTYTALNKTIEKYTEIADRATTKSTGLSEAQKKYLEGAKKKEILAAYNQAIEDGNAALIERLFLMGAIDKKQEDEGLSKIISSAKERNQMEERTKDLVGDTRTETEKYTEALDNLKESEQNVTDAQGEQAKAAEALKGAIESLSDAQYNFAQASKDLEDLLATGSDGMTDFEEATQKAQNALDAQKDAENAVSDAQKDLENSTKDLTNAYDGLEKSKEAVTKATEALTKAHEDLERSDFRVLKAHEAVSKAEQDIIDLREQASEQARDAAFSIEKAQGDQIKAQARLGKAQEKVDYLRGLSRVNAETLQDAENELADAKIGVTQADEDLHDATNDLNDATNTLAGTSESAVQADMDLRDAKISLNETLVDHQHAINDVNNSLTDLNAKEQAVVDAQGAVVSATNNKEAAVGALALAQQDLTNKTNAYNTTASIAASLDDTEVKFAAQVAKAKRDKAQAAKELADQTERVAKAQQDQVDSTNKLNLAEVARLATLNKVNQLAIQKDTGNITAGLAALAQFPTSAATPASTTNITVNVQGNVLSEQNLVDVVHQGLLAKQSRNGPLGFTQPL